MYTLKYNFYFVVVLWSKLYPITLHWSAALSLPPLHLTPPSLPLHHIYSQGVVLVVIVAALCDLSYTISQDTVQQVANFQYVTPIVLTLTMV